MWFIIDFSHTKNTVQKKKKGKIKFSEYKAHDSINLFETWLLEQTWHDKTPKWMTQNLSDKNLPWLYHCDWFCPSVHSPHTWTGMCQGPISQIQISNGNVAEVGSHVSYWISHKSLQSCMEVCWPKCQNTPATCWFGVLCVVQQTGALPCLGTLAVAHSDGLKSDTKQHLGSSYEIIAAALWWRGAGVSSGVLGWAVGSGHLCPCP